MKKTTGELLELLKNTKNIDQYLESSADDLIEAIPLADYLNSLLREKNLKKSDVIRLAGLDRSYAYQIFDGQKSPGRDRVVALCLAMNLNVEESQQLLKHTGYTPLYAKLKQDSVLLFGLAHNLSVTDVNELLYELGEPLLELTTNSETPRSSHKPYPSQP